MKKILNIILVLLLVSFSSACVEENVSVDDIISEVIKETLKNPIPKYTNINKGYYRYYLPTDVGRKSGDMISNILTFNNNNFVMCINAPNIIKDHYYPNSEGLSDTSINTVFGSEVEIKEYSGTYVDYGNIPVDYTVLVLNVDSDLYYLQLTTRYLSFGAVLYKTGLPAMLTKMLDIAKTVRINFEQVAVDFSNREIASSSALQALDLFKEQKPSSGYVIDLLFPSQEQEKEKEVVDDIVDEED